MTPARAGSGNKATATGLAGAKAGGKEGRWAALAGKGVWEGSRVVRGLDWKWGDSDGGAGGCGRVASSTRDGWVWVEWAPDSTRRCRVGAEGCIDVWPAADPQ
jgi:hypothetical protein